MYRLRLNRSLKLDTPVAVYVSYLPGGRPTRLEGEVDLQLHLRMDGFL